MIENVFQQIYDELEQFLINDWEKMVVYLEYGEASYSFSFHIKVGGEYIKCFDIPGIDEESIMNAFKNIDCLVSEVRKSERENWTNMTMIISRDGSMHADYDYTDLTSGSYQYKKNWKSKYLI